MHIVYYFLAVVPLLLLVWRYLYSYFRRIADWYGGGLSEKRRKLLAGIAAAAMVLPAGYIWSLWAVVLLYLMLFSLAMDLANHLVKRLSKKPHSRWTALWRTGLVPIVCTALLFSYGYWNMQQIHETDYTVLTQKSIRDEGYRATLLSDLHFGTTMDTEKLQTVCDRISDTKPDFVVLAGDIFDEGTTKGEMLAAVKALGGMQSRCGIYYVFGNHDQNDYVRHKSYTADELRKALTDAGICVLEDERVRIGGDLTLIGRRDRSETDREPAAALLQNVNQDDFLILADHQPKDLRESREAGYDLELSGHTHGGQIWPCGIIADLFNPAHVSYGQHTHGNYQLIVTSGVAGWGYAVRTEHHCEYVVIDIKKAT